MALFFIHHIGMLIPAQSKMTSNWSPPGKKDIQIGHPPGQIDIQIWHPSEQFDTLQCDKKLITLKPEKFEILKYNFPFSYSPIKTI